jgi:protocatechuate 3,4-dioxygenase beta subunit
MSRSIAAPLWRKPGIDLARRRALLGFGAGIAGAVLLPRPASAQATGSCALTPDSGEGPFYFDPELVRIDIAEGAEGAPLSLDISVVRERDCAVLDGARVDVWHADGVGLYSGYERQPGVGGGIPTDARGQTYLRGTQFTDREGRVHFDTVYPSWYGGRTPHVHFKVFLSDREVVASQIFFPDEFNDEVFERFEPYRTHRARRTGFNANDMFLSDGVDGVFGSVERRPDGYDATAALVIRA